MPIGWMAVCPRSGTGDRLVDHPGCGGRDAGLWRRSWHWLLRHHLPNARGIVDRLAVSFCRPRFKSHPRRDDQANEQAQKQHHSDKPTKYAVHITHPRSYRPAAYSPNAPRLRGLARRLGRLRGWDNTCRQNGRVQTSNSQTQSYRAG